MPAIVESLEELSLSPKDITHLAVALGPGGFSAVRVGISCVLGLAVPKQLPVIGIPTHDVEFEPHRNLVSSDTPVYTLIPAGRNEVSWTRHAIDSEQKTGVASPTELAQTLEPNALLCGEACDLMTDHFKQSQFPGHLPPTRDPSSIIDIALDKFNLGLSTAYEELRPIYARAPSISTPKPAK
jgi:tRNA threonylcarbamoyl adenosine modification protein YeaZ